MHTRTDNDRTEDRATTERHGPPKALFLVGALLLAKAAARRRFMAHHGDAEARHGHHGPPWAARRDARAEDGVDDVVRA